MIGERLDSSGKYRKLCMHISKHDGRANQIFLTQVVRRLLNVK